jgi:hypothetical protein
MKVAGVHTNVWHVLRSKYTLDIECYTLNIKYQTQKILSINRPQGATDATEVVELPSGRTLAALDLDGESWPRSGLIKGI